MRCHGFSLVELSIVLVIIGLLVGGIPAGQSLIRASELRAVSSEYQRYQSAVMAFRDKYFAIPGDFSNATSFWGSLGGTGSDSVCHAIAATSIATCNGDGDNTLLWGGNATNQYEWYRFWQHLANAGLIEGQYTGVISSPVVIGTNVPPVKLSKVYFTARNGFGYTTTGASGVSAGSVNIFAGNYGLNQLSLNQVGLSATVAGSFPLNPSEAWNIDTKMDDGVPSAGRLWAFKGDGTNTRCTTTAGIVPPGDAGATYQLDSVIKDCTLYLVRAF